MAPVRTRLDPPPGAPTCAPSRPRARTQRERCRQGNHRRGQARPRPSSTGRWQHRTGRERPQPSAWPPARPPDQFDRDARERPPRPRPSYPPRKYTPLRARRGMHRARQPCGQRGPLRSATLRSQPSAHGASSARSGPSPVRHPFSGHLPAPAFVIVRATSMPFIQGIAHRIGGHGWGIAFASQHRAQAPVRALPRNTRQ